MMVAGFALLTVSSAHAGKYGAIYAFQGDGPYGGEPPFDAANPAAGLTLGPQGQLYGTTELGGTGALGTVFMLTPSSSGQNQWTEQILHSFPSASGDGYLPETPVILGSDGSIYATTIAGGAANPAVGTVYKLAYAPGWPLTTLHSFSESNDGFDPESSVAFGSDGLLYGSTNDGGAYGLGTDYSVSPLGDAIEYQIVSSFGGGFSPARPVGFADISGGQRNGLIGVAPQNSPFKQSDVGVVYQLNVSPVGIAHERIIYRFRLYDDVSSPFTTPIVGQGKLAGTLVGCTNGGGTHGQGGVYQITPTSSGGVSESVLYNFGDEPHDPSGGPHHYCNLIQDTRSGKLYGTTDGGGAFGDGAFFELDPPSVTGETWTEKVDVHFNPQSTGGINPQGTLVRIGDTYYGTAYSGSTYGYGAVFELTP